MLVFGVHHPPTWPQHEERLKNPPNWPNQPKPFFISDQIVVHRTHTHKLPNDTEFPDQIGQLIAHSSSFLGSEIHNFQIVFSQYAVLRATTTSVSSVCVFALKQQRSKSTRSTCRSPPASSTDPYVLLA